VATLDRIAYNPLPWGMTPEGFDATRVPPLEEIAPVLLGAGFGAIQADVPEGGRVEDFAASLAAVGLAPAPGYFSAPFADPQRLAVTLERARRVAAGQAALGLTEVFLADERNALRSARPGMGAAYERDRLEQVTEHVAAAAEAISAEGVRPCLHPHVGTWIETAVEAEHILASVTADHLLLGPDSGHLAWAGADPAAFVRRYASRVGAVHVKDVHLDALAAARNDGCGFLDALFRHVVTEPGRGGLDLSAMLDALGPGFGGWVVVEVDVFDLPTPAESIAAAGAWAGRSLALQ
jgi:inosose dehydratase